MSNTQEDIHDILKPFAVNIARNLTDRCIAYLKDIEASLSGDDSGLLNVWNEICVQIQGEHSIFWDAYDETVRSFVSGHVSELKDYEQKALWYQCEEYWDWCIYDRQNEDEAPPIIEEDITNYILTEFIYPEAMEYTNESIEDFKESQYFD